MWSNCGFASQIKSQTFFFAFVLQNSCKTHQRQNTPASWPCNKMLTSYFLWSYSLETQRFHLHNLPSLMDHKFTYSGMFGCGCARHFDVISYLFFFLSNCALTFYFFSCSSMFVWSLQLHWLWKLCTISVTWKTKHYAWRIIYVAKKKVALLLFQIADVSDSTVTGFTLPFIKAMMIQ